VNQQLCDGCGERLEGRARSDRRYHDARCRKVAFERRQRERQAPEPTRPEPAHVDREAVLERALAEDRLVTLLATAARSNWRAAAFLLERRYPQRWGAGRREPEPLLPGESDAFAELDQLAARRRLHHVYD
jgi:hypothetical protein